MPDPASTFSEDLADRLPLTVTRPSWIQAWTFVRETPGSPARWRRRTRSSRSRSSPRSATILRLRERVTRGRPPSSSGSTTRFRGPL
jgi:hypothetical protein